MMRGWSIRVSGSLGAAAIGLALALLAGASLTGALLALAAGSAAASLLWSGRQAPRSLEPDKSFTQAHSLPGILDLLAAVDDPLLLVRDRRILHANAAALALLGEHVSGADVRLAIRHPAAAELLAERGDGDPVERPTRIELVGLGERERRWEMVVTRMADGSRLVRLIDRSAAYASERMRTDFVANASHELRTPLATLLGYLETLQDEDAAEHVPTRTRFLAIMWNEARRMQRLVEDLLSLSRVEAERFTLPSEPVRLLSLVRDTVDAFDADVDKRAGDIRIEGGGGDPTVLGDRSQLAQLVHNLLANAMKYGRPGTDVTVAIAAAEAGSEMLCFSVTDRGEGIAAEHLPRLTERFYRVDPGRSRTVGGTGLGLAIVKHIVDRHRGRLEIRSDLGEGTIVRVYLPRATVSADIREEV